MEKNGYYEVQSRLLADAKKQFDEQLDRFSKIWCKEVLNRKRKTRRGIIAEEVLTKISDDIYAGRRGYGQYWTYRELFESAYNQGNVFYARRAVENLKMRLDGYKEEVRRGQLSWYGRLG